MSRFRKLFHNYIVVQKSTHIHTTSQLLCQISKRSLHTAQFSCLPLSRSSEFYEEGTCSNSLPPNRVERYIANIASLDGWLVDSKSIIHDPCHSYVDLCMNHLYFIIQATEKYSAAIYQMVGDHRK